MPRRLLALLPAPVRVPVIVVIVAAAVFIPLAGVAIRQEAARRDARLQRAEIAERRAVLRADQAPHSGRLAAEDAPVPALERYVSADVRERQAAGVMGGSTAQTTCREGRRTFACFVEVSRTRTGAGTLASGFHFTAALNRETSRLTWCKLNPRPIHPDTQSYVRLPLAPACVGGSAAR